MPSALEPRQCVHTMVAHQCRYVVGLGLALAVFAGGLSVWRLACAKYPNLQLTGLVYVRDLEELKVLLRPGTSTQELLQALGPPVSAFRFTNGSDRWMYGLSRKHMQTPWDPAILGCTVLLTNGSVAWWDFIYSLTGSPRDDKGLVTIQQPGQQESLDPGPLALMFHVLRDDALEAQYDLWQGLEDDSWHRLCEAEYRLEGVSQVDGVHWRDSAGVLGWGIQLRLRRGDRKAFEAFTAPYGGRMVVITFRDQVIAASLLTMPIRNGELEISQLRTRNPEELLVALKRLEKHGF